MKKSIILFILLFIATETLFAEKRFNLDDAIHTASRDLVENCRSNSILVIDDFESPSEQLTLYIRTQLVESIANEYKRIRVITREEMYRIEKELAFQHYFGKVSPETIINAADKLGANTIAFGKFEELNNAYELRIRMLDVKTGVYIFGETYKVSRSSKIEQLSGRASPYCKVGIGFGAELNLNSFDSYSPALSISFDYNIFRKVAVGFKLFASKEPRSELTIFEPLGSLRFYLASPSGEPGTGVFLEGLGGVSIISVNSNKSFSKNFGAGFGYRMAFRSVYIEPAIRFGYPYSVGTGLSTGFKF